jgi:hypothetical protein
VDEEEVYSAEIDEPAEETEPEPEVTVEEPAKEPEPPKEDPAKEIESKYESKVAELQKEINRLGYALRKTDKEKPKADEPKFSKAQLLSIMQEHREDPAVMMQVFEELAKDAAKGAEISAGKAADIASKKNEMERWLRNIDGIDDEASPVGQTVNKIIGDLYLDDHPFAKFLAASVNVNMQMDKIIEKAKEDVRKELLGAKAEESRKEKIKTNAPAQTGKPSESASVALTPSQMETAKSLFGNDKKAIAKYAKMLAKSKSGTYQTA